MFGFKLVGSMLAGLSFSAIKLFFKTNKVTIIVLTVLTALTIGLSAYIIHYRTNMAVEISKANIELTTQQEANTSLKVEINNLGESKIVDTATVTDLINTNNKTDNNTNNIVTVKTTKIKSINNNRTMSNVGIDTAVSNVQIDSIYSAYNNAINKTDVKEVK